MTSSSPCHEVKSSGAVRLVKLALLGLVLGGVLCPGEVLLDGTPPHSQRTAVFVAGFFLALGWLLLAVIGAAIVLWGRTRKLPGGERGHLVRRISLLLVLLAGLSLMLGLILSGYSDESVGNLLYGLGGLLGSGASALGFLSLIRFSFLMLTKRNPDPSEMWMSWMGAFGGALAIPLSLAGFLSNLSFL